MRDQPHVPRIADQPRRLSRGPVEVGIDSDEAAAQHQDGGDVRSDEDSQVGAGGALQRLEEGSALPEPRAQQPGAAHGLKHDQQDQRRLDEWMAIPPTQRLHHCPVLVQPPQPNEMVPEVHDQEDRQQAGRRNAVRQAQPCRCSRQRCAVVARRRHDNRPGRHPDCGPHREIRNRGGVDVEQDPDQGEQRRTGKGQMRNGASPRFCQRRPVNPSETRRREQPQRRHREYQHEPDGHGC